ncbi:cytochrome c biogenesis CcdA family protein [Psychrilyobacter atlanticus]|uniref:cytochrome c biogenesis CcdA family protein n=1 Tax=Psychrilyobacter atlanticus TaxID=271091 RepID=UPI000427C78D|nr:cytochrome c biogenesis protein CcdA [Psychrilyobacter atlanticus]
MEINILIVFLAGMGTFLAPCIIPLVPSYLSYISGIVLGKKHGGKQKFKVILHTLFFILGFGTAFSALQILLFNFTNLASRLIGNNILNMIFGGIIVIMGMHMIGIFKITKLYSEKRMNFSFIRRNIGTSYLFGFAFGFGWTPCMGPVLFTVMSYLAGADTVWMGTLYIWTYTFGLGVPFMIFALFMDKTNKLDFIKKNFLFSDKVSGVILIVMGTLLAMNKMTIFLSWGFRDEIVEFLRKVF